MAPTLACRPPLRDGEQLSQATLDELTGLAGAIESDMAASSQQRTSNSVQRESNKSGAAAAAARGALGPQDLPIITALGHLPSVAPAVLRTLRPVNVPLGMGSIARRAPFVRRSTSDGAGGSVAAGTGTGAKQDGPDFMFAQPLLAYTEIVESKAGMNTRGTAMLEPLSALILSPPSVEALARELAAGGYAAAQRARKSRRAADREARGEEYEEDDDDVDGWANPVCSLVDTTGVTETFWVDEFLSIDVPAGEVARSTRTLRAAMWSLLASRTARVAREPDTRLALCIGQLLDISVRASKRSAEANATAGAAAAAAARPGIPPPVKLGLLGSDGGGAKWEEGYRMAPRWLEEGSARVDMDEVYKSSSLMKMVRRMEEDEDDYLPFAPPTGAAAAAAAAGPSGGAQRDPAGAADAADATFGIGVVSAAGDNGEGELAAVFEERHDEDDITAAHLVPDVPAPSRGGRGFTASELLAGEKAARGAGSAGGASKGGLSGEAAMLAALQMANSAILRANRGGGAGSRGFSSDARGGRGAAGYRR